MIKDIARQGLNLVRRTHSRLAYESRIRTVPSLELDSKKNVLIITIDCLRNDHVSCTGYKRETTPFIDSLESFTPAIASAPWTFSSVPSILTGLYPHKHGAIYSDDSSRNQDLNNPPNSVHEDVYTLAELLDASSYETRFDTAITTAAIPIRRRFKTTNIQNQAVAEDLLSGIQNWWNSTSKPKFGYVQLGDLHEPLHKPERLPFGDIPDIEGIERWRFEQGDIDTPEFNRYREGRELLYDTLIGYVDSEIKRMLNELDEVESTIVVVTSDHGEEFWEYTKFEQEHFDDPRGNAGVGHGHALVPPVIEVPVATNIEDIDTEPRASSIDIVPTILHELGASGVNQPDGIPLQKRQREEPVLSQEVAYGPNQISITDDNDHLIYVPEKSSKLLINFSTGEERTDQERQEELLEYVFDEKMAGAGINFSRDVQEQLSDLGYAE